MRNDFKMTINMVLSFHIQNTYHIVIPQHLNKLSMAIIKYKHMYNIYQ